jgi:hypothetical protein
VPASERSPLGCRAPACLVDPARYTDKTFPCPNASRNEHKIDHQVLPGRCRTTRLASLEEAFEKADVVYLDLDGVRVDVMTIDEQSPRVVLRLPTATAEQLGLLAKAAASE